MTADTRSPRRPRRSRRALVAGALAALGWAHASGACGSGRCDEGDCDSFSDPRLFDRLCKRHPTGDACTVSGDAEQTTGITGDSVGFRLGDRGGTLTMLLLALEGVQGSFPLDVEILAASTDPEGSGLDATLDWGSCGKECPENPPVLHSTIQNDYRWVTVVSELPTAPFARSLPHDAVLSLTGKNIDIADLRSTANIQPQPCSFVGPIGARSR